MYRKILMLSGVMISIMAAIFGYGYRSATRPPDNTPQSFLKLESQKSKKVVVCIGDSITHGRVSHNYVDELTHRFSPEQYTFVNAGINSQLAFNVLQRVDEIIQCEPDFITLMIGTNDAQASLSQEKALHYVNIMNLPRIPDQQWYQKNLGAIIDRLKKRTRAQIALLSLPPITEDVEHKAYLRAGIFSSIVRQLACEAQIAYLPVNESFHKALVETGQGKRSSFAIGDKWPLYTAIFYHYLLRYSWDDVAQENNLIFLTDNIHLSRKGADMVADLIETFIRSRQNNSNH